jgi:hypothetical protein
MRAVHGEHGREGVQSPGPAALSVIGLLYHSACNQPEACSGCQDREVGGATGSWGLVAYSDTELSSALLAWVGMLPQCGVGSAQVAAMLQHLCTAHLLPGVLTLPISTTSTITSTTLIDGSVGGPAAAEVMLPASPVLQQLLSALAATLQHLPSHTSNDPAAAAVASPPPLSRLRLALIAHSMAAAPVTLEPSVESVTRLQLAVAGFPVSTAVSHSSAPKAHLGVTEEESRALAKLLKHQVRFLFEIVHTS